MNTSIRSYTLHETTIAHVPEGAEFLSISAHKGAVILCARVDPERRTEMLTFRTVKLTHPSNLTAEDVQGRYIGSTSGVAWTICHVFLLNTAQTLTELEQHVVDAARRCCVPFPSTIPGEWRLRDIVQAARALPQSFLLSSGPCIVPTTPVSVSMDSARHDLLIVRHAPDGVYVHLSDDRIANADAVEAMIPATAQWRVSFV